jgi:LmbE family N-acetylglucosaminyl deacetylase
LGVIGAPRPLNIAGWNTVLMVGAHPDDIEGFSAGLSYELVLQKKQVYYLIMTNGNKGCGNKFCANWTAQQIATKRHQEAIDAAVFVGVPSDHVYMLEYEDCMLLTYPYENPFKDIIYYIRKVKPDVIIGFSPTPNLDLLPTDNGQYWGDLGYHPDHQYAGKLTLDAQFAAGLNLLYPELGKGWNTPQFYLWEFDKPTYYFGLTEELLNIKTEAYLKHESQFDGNVDGMKWWFDWFTSEVSNRSNTNTIYRNIEGYKSYF